MKYGVATAAFQIEGSTTADGRGESIWDRYCATPGAIKDGHTGDPACDHYRRWPEDLDLMQALGVQSYRFSIAWPRVVPDGTGAVNQAGLDFYRRLVEGLLERDIEPIVTLYHWDLPQVLQDAGGWPARDTAAHFASYAGVVAAALGDLVEHWITHNEPWCSSIKGYALGEKAPGLRDWPAGLAASHHILLSHGLAVEAVRAAAPGAKLGIALNLAPVHPASDSDADRMAALRHDGFYNRWFLEPVMRGRYPEDMLALYERHFGPFDSVRDGDLHMISVATDFLGVNYYSPARVQASLNERPLGIVAAPPQGELTAMGWEVDPNGLRELLLRLARDYGPMPVFITENGASYDDPPTANGRVDDPQRVLYLAGHLEAVREAMAAGVDVQRYCVWSLLDNFEWEEGYGKRFGIVHVDYDTQRRVPKASALWYRDYIAARGGL